MSDPVPILCWDTCIVIDAIRHDKKWWPEIEAMYNDAVLGKVRLLVSEVTVAEACKLTGKKTPTEEVLAAMESFFGNVFIDRRPVDDRVSMLAARLIRDYNTGTCDALIVATACVHRATAFYTRDGLKDTGAKTKLLTLNGKLRHKDEHPFLPVLPPIAADYLKAELFRKSNAS